MSGYTPAFRRAIAGLILVALIAAVWLAIIQPLHGLVATRQADIAELSNQLERVKAILARRPQVDRRRAELQAQFAASRSYWTGMSPTAVAAKVQEIMRQAAAENGGRVTASTEMPSVSERGFRRITLRFSVEGSMDTLVRILAALEMASPSLFVEALNVTSGGASGSADRPVSMSIVFDVGGYLAGPSS